MEITKIFSSLEDGEKLYSVLLNEDEMCLFSEIQKEFGNPKNKLAKKAWEKRGFKTRPPKIYF